MESPTWPTAAAEPPAAAANPAPLATAAAALPPPALCRDASHPARRACLPPPAPPHSPTSSRWMAKPKLCTSVSRLPIVSLVVLVTNRAATPASRSRCSAAWAPGVAASPTCSVPFRSMSAAWMRGGACGRGRYGWPACLGGAAGLPAHRGMRHRLQIQLGYRGGEGGASIIGPPQQARSRLLCAPASP